MKGRKGFTLIELLVVITIIAILAAILFPIFGRVRDTARASTCQSNMKQIGIAMKQYIGDWDETYPTNRLLPTAQNPEGVFNEQVQLSTEAHLLEDKRFQYGVNWVEALYTYMERATQGSDYACVWKCPRTLDVSFPPIATPLGRTAAVTYAMNSWMCEVPESAISGASNVMLVRELDRRMNSVLRPTLESVAGKREPGRINVFLNLGGEPFPGVLRTDLHRSGSHILFTDGSVRHFSLGYMPASVQGNRDPATMQYWNSLEPDLKKIAISPSGASY